MTSVNFRSLNWALQREAALRVLLVGYDRALFQDLKRWLLYVRTDRLKGCFWHFLADHPERRHTP